MADSCSPSSDWLVPATDASQQLIGVLAKIRADTSRGFELTSIKAAFVVERLNEVFGPCGCGWRYVHLPSEWIEGEAPPEVALQFKVTVGGVNPVLWDAQAHGWVFVLDGEAWSWPIFFKWFNAYRLVENACWSMPLALNHGQYSFQPVGWAPREPSPQLVTFDLETMSFWPRFFDIAGILTPLANYTGQDQHQLFKIYFDRLCQLIQLDLDLNAAYHEQKLIGILDAFQTLPWLLLIKDSEIPGLIDTSLTKAGIDLYNNLTSLKLV